MPVWYSEEFDEMKISNCSSLVRVVDPRYPTNLAIMLLSTHTGGVLSYPALPRDKYERPARLH